MSLYNPRVRRSLVLIVSLWTVAIRLAHADSATEALDQVVRCTAIADGTERLKCFDRAAPRAKEAVSPRVEDFGKPAPRPAEVANVSAAVRDLSKTARGRAIFVLDNGQTWRQIDGDDTQVYEAQPGTPMKVTIEHGLFDSYRLSIDGRNGSVRVRRVE